MAEMTRALPMATFHGPYPERFTASLARGISRTERVLFFSYLCRREALALHVFRRSRQRWILDVHDIPHLQQLHFGVRADEGVRSTFLAFARNCDVLLFPSASLAAMFEADVGAKVAKIVVQNAANPGKFAPAPLPRRKVFSYVGGYAPTRGIERLVGAFSKVRRRRSDIWLWLVVPDALPGWMRLVEGVVVAPKVTYESGAADVFRASYACVIPHDKNPYMDAATPIKLFEAMASARPVVATDCYETEKIVRAEACGTVVPADEAALADAIDRLANDRPLAERLGMNGRKAVEARHNWQSRAQNLLRILKNSV